MLADEETFSSKCLELLHSPDFHYLLVVTAQDPKCN